MTLHSIAQLVLLGWLLGNSARAIEPGGNLRSVWESKFWSRDRGAIGNAGPSAIDSSGGTTFTAYKNSSLNLGIYSERHGDVPQLIASQGDAAPGTNEIFAELFQLRTNRSGNVAFFGRLLPDDDVSWKNDHGIWAESSGGGLRLVAREGGTAPGLERGEQLGQLAYVDRPGSSNGGWPESDGQSATLSPFSFNSRGETAYYSRITDENGVYRNNMGICSEGGGNGPRLVARTGMSAPGFTWEGERIFPSSWAARSSRVVAPS